MPAKVLIIDTSLLCCLLSVSGKESCGSGENRWDAGRVSRAIEDEGDATLVMPLATIIETGNHISHSPNRRYEVSQEFSKYLSATAEAETPWAAFTDQAELWSSEKMKVLAGSWPALAAAGTSMGDATIRDVAEYYSKAGFEVKIMTGDEQLRAYEPRSVVDQPRRRGR